MHLTEIFGWEVQYPSQNQGAWKVGGLGERERYGGGKGWSRERNNEGKGENQSRGRRESGGRGRGREDGKWQFRYIEMTAPLRI